MEEVLEPHAIIEMEICCGNGVGGVDPEPLFTAPYPGFKSPRFGPVGAGLVL